MRTVILYILGAVIATICNIAAQELAIRIYDGVFGVITSVGVGTLVGLAAKYVWDKRYIFAFRAASTVHDARTFGLYTVMGLFTTVIFWGFEFGFDWYFQTKEMRYLGGVIGLAVGYTVKYFLDKAYVFKP